MVNDKENKGRVWFWREGRFNRKGRMALYLVKEDRTKVSMEQRDIVLLASGSRLEILFEDESRSLSSQTKSTKAGQHEILERLVVEEVDDLV